MSQLAFSYKYDASFFDAALNRDDFGWLAVSAVSDHFQARGGFWVQWQDVREFGEALAAFPISRDAPIVAQWGYNAQEGEDLIVRVEIAAADLRGNLRVSFEIADLHETQNRTRSAFPTNYPDVQAFSRQIAELMDGKLIEAILQGR
jgi:hypothetical protein